MTTPYPEIEKEEIRELELYRFEGETIIIEDAGSAAEALEEIKRESIIGFDTERKPSFKKGNINPIALIQIATRNKVFLMRINHFKLPPALIRIMENPDILKVGVGLDDDLQGLQQLQKFKSDGFIDLSKYFQANDYRQSNLKYLAALVLNVRISKNQQVSNWERDPLSPSQIRYAATDAWVPREIYLTMVEDGNYPET